MFYFIAIVTAIAALSFAFWKSRQASAAKSAAAEARNELPRLIAETLHWIIGSGKGEPASSGRAPMTWSGSIDYADVNGDGRNELLVQYPAGAHGCALRVFGLSPSGIEELAYVGTGTPAGFEFGDFDGDGKVEIKTQETDWGAGLPYATAPRFTLLLRWDGSRFAEVSRQRA